MKHTLPYAKELMGGCGITQGTQPRALRQPRGGGGRSRREGTDVSLRLVHDAVVW